MRAVPAGLRDSTLSAALLEVADHAGVSEHLSQYERLAGAAGFLKLREFSPLQALELRLEAARGK